MFYLLILPCALVVRVTSASIIYGQNGLQGKQIFVFFLLMWAAIPYFIISPKVRRRLIEVGDQFVLKYGYFLIYWLSAFAISEGSIFLFTKLIASGALDWIQSTWVSAVVLLAISSVGAAIIFFLVHKCRIPDDWAS